MKLARYGFEISRRGVIEAVGGHQRAPGGTTRWWLVQRIVPTPDNRTGDAVNVAAL